MLTPKIIECLLNWRVTAETAPKTVIVDPETLNTAFHRAEPHGVILKNPGTAIRPPNAESSERDVFSNDGVERLTNAAPTLDWQPLILLDDLGALSPAGRHPESLLTTPPLTLYEVPRAPAGVFHFEHPTFRLCLRTLISKQLQTCELRRSKGRQAVPHSGSYSGIGTRGCAEAFGTPDFIGDF